MLTYAIVVDRQEICVCFILRCGWIVYTHTQSDKPDRPENQIQCHLTSARKKFQTSISLVI